MNAHPCRTSFGALAIALSITAGCTRPTAQGGGPATTDLGGCDPAALGLARAQVITAWRAPEGCARRGGGGGSSEPSRVRSEQEFSSAFACREGVSSGLDFSRQTLFVLDTTLSPASAGFAVYADGARVTLVSRQRAPCPDDPRPMPMPFAFAFVVDHAETTLTQSVCTLPARCR